MIVIAHFIKEYLLNSLWQAPMLCAVAWLLARVLQRLGPAAEHRVWVGALLAQIVLPACALPGLRDALRLMVAGKGAADGSVTFTLGPAVPVGGGVAASALHYGMLLYLAGTASLTLRFVWQCVQLRLLAREATPLSLKPENAMLLQQCCARFGVVKVHVAVAREARTPLTFGLRRPTLLLPRGFVEEVAAPELRTTLSHELAHVARRDAAKHVLYRLLWLPVAYHPAAWLVMTNLAETRERVCDRMAAAATGDARQYAHSLLELASLLTARRPVQSHAVGLFDANQLERRVLMLNRRVLTLARPLRIALVAGSTVVATIACTAITALHLEAQPLSGPSTAAKAPVRISGGVAAGQLVSKVTPVYPPEAKQAKVQGAVVLHAIIGKSGEVERLSVISGPEALQASALDAVRQWVYKPYLLNGDPTEVDTTITVTFSLAQ